MSLLTPPPGFPPLLIPVWPLIWVQVLVLRAWVRATYGKGTQYHWSVTLCGRVYLTSIDWVPGQAAPEWLRPAAHPNARLAAALDGTGLTPAYARAAAAGAPCFADCVPAAPHRVARLFVPVPLPET